MRPATLRWSLWGLLAVVLVATWVGSRAMRPTPVGSSEPPPVLATLPEFELTNRDGRTVGLSELRGRVWVANFIFTRCALSCPRMTSQMLRLGAALPEAMEIARVSISVDPGYDSPEVLETYAASYSIDDPDWLFLTGERDAVGRLTTEGFMLPIVDDPPPEAFDPQEPILHSDRFVLVDRRGRIRGYYQPAVREEYEKLLRDISSVSEEKDVTPTTEAVTAACTREIEELHAFFGQWFLAELPATDSAFARFASVLAEEFSLIGPDGEEVGQKEILERIRTAHGSRKAAGFEIWIEDARARATTQGHCLMTYQEWQRSAGTTKVRLSTVLMRANKQTPNGVEWLHLHETWLPVEDGR